MWEGRPPHPAFGHLLLHREKAARLETFAARDVSSCKPAIEPFAFVQRCCLKCVAFSWLTMSKNGLYVLIGLLALIVVGLAGYMFYQQSQEPSLEIKVDSNGIQVNGNG